jgi:predicted 3-demethylubiquinone-9 3-methyltransferase (glyoxalase superfamily)
LNDRFGLSWQVTPTRPAELLADPDYDRSRRVFAAVMPMKKTDFAALEAAHGG